MEKLHAVHNFQLIIDYAIDLLTGYAPKSEYDTIFPNEWSEEDKSHVIKQLHEVFIQISTNSDFDISSFDSSQIAYINEAVSKRKVDILKSKMKEHNSSLGCVIHNFDWKLKWIIGSSVSSQTKYPILQVDFTNIKLLDNEIINNYLSIEMNKKELSQLIDALESVNT